MGFGIRILRLSVNYGTKSQLILEPPMRCGKWNTADFGTNSVDVGGGADSKGSKV